MRKKYLTMKSTVVVLLSMLALVCSPGKQSSSIRFPYLWLDEPGFGGNIDQQNFTEPSGICFHPLRKTLFVVSDEGEVAEITKEGRPVANHRVPGDLEGITVDPGTGLLYIVVEGDDVILEFDPDEKRITRRFTVNRRYKDDPFFLQKQEDAYDNGIECLEFVPNASHPEGGTFYAGNQWDPSCIMELDVPLKSARGETAEARILRVFSVRIDDPAAMCFDKRSGFLNIVSDADNILFEVTLQGALVRAYAFLGDNQEGIALDDEGFLYIAQDSGGILKVKDLR
ncbi:MAG: SdiA-regulated domain-containing protein [Candidatus Aminicenantes bacterium]|nr:SdiA-regulated domain-containing protein [Candidatus Aminicenantes bacterium]